MIDKIDTLIYRETQKAIKAILESAMSQDDDERSRQKRQQAAISARGVESKDKSTKKDEADKDDAKSEKASDEKPEKDDKREDRTGGKGTADSPKIKDPDPKTLKNPPVKAVVDKVNALRGGKSLKDPDVRKSFEQYYKSLSTAEQQSLLLFLTGIAQVLSEVEPGAEAIDPSDAGLRVRDTGEDKTAKDKPEKTSGESGTQDNPIVVGESPSKVAVLKALKAYRSFE